MDTLTTLFRHNLWANEKLFVLCAELSVEQLEATVPGTFGTIRKTLEHIVLAEQGYFSRISTGERYYPPTDVPPPTVTELTAALRATGQGFIEWVYKVQAGDTVTIDWDGTPRDVPKPIIMTQVINHATEHRAQINVILTQLGIEPPSLDSWTYFSELAE